MVIVYVQKMKGHKTVIISTHDMEEADILGDRIAIMHTGQLISYGTPFFLKKILGKLIIADLIKK